MRRNRKGGGISCNPRDLSASRFWSENITTGCGFLRAMIAGVTEAWVSCGLPVCGATSGGCGVSYNPRDILASRFWSENITNGRGILWGLYFLMWAWLPMAFAVPVRGSTRLHLALSPPEAWASTRFEPCASRASLLAVPYSPVPACSIQRPS